MFAHFRVCLKKRHEVADAGKFENSQACGRFEDLLDGPGAQTRSYETACAQRLFVVFNAR